MDPVMLVVTVASTPFKKVRIVEPSLVITRWFQVFRLSAALDASTFQAVPAWTRILKALLVLAQTK
jgi:hypothetical protein